MIIFIRQNLKQSLQQTYCKDKTEFCCFNILKKVEDYLDFAMHSSELHTYNKA